MRAVVLTSFIDSKNGRHYRRRDIISISKERFQILEGRFVAEAPKGAKLSPKRDENGQCIICNSK